MDLQLTTDEAIAHPSKHPSQAVVNALIKGSTHDGKLNLNELASIIQETAQNRVLADPHVKDITQDGAMRELVDKSADAYNKIARKLLGVVKLNSLELLLNDGENNHGLTCTYPKDVDFNDIHNSMSANHVVCEKPKSIIR